MSRGIFICHTVDVEWRGALAEMRIYLGHDGRVCIEIPTLMPTPLILNDDRLAGLSAAIRAVTKDRNTPTLRCIGQPPVTDGAA